MKVKGKFSYIDKRMPKNSLAANNIFSITQGDQKAEDEKVTSLGILGYYQGDKRGLFKVLNTLNKMGKLKYYKCCHVEFKSFVDRVPGGF